MVAVTRGKQKALAPERQTTNGVTTGTIKSGNISEISKYRPSRSGNKPLKSDKKTDQTLWRLKDDHGRQTWHFLTEEDAKEWPQSFADKYFLNLPLVSINFDLYPNFITNRLAGCTNTPETHHSPRFGQERTRVLSAPPARGRKLGIRIWRTTLSHDRHHRRLDRN